MVSPKFPLIILAGGFGTRLQSVVKNTPKILAPVGDSTFLAHLVRYYYSQGIRFMVFSLFYEAEQVKSAVREMQLPTDLRVSFVVEPEPLGTGGAVKYAVESLRLSGAVLVCNGDTFLTADLSRLYGIGCDGVMGLVEVGDTGRYGRVDVDNIGMISKFVEKSSSSGRGLINAGVFKISCEVLQDIPARTFSMERDVFPKLAAEEKLFGVKLDGEFIDIGIPEDYRKFCELKEHY